MKTANNILEPKQNYTGNEPAGKLDIALFRLLYYICVVDDDYL